MKKFFFFIIFFIYLVNPVFSEEKKSINFNGNLHARWLSSWSPHIQYNQFISELYLGMDHKMLEAWGSYKVQFYNDENGDFRVGLNKAMIGLPIYQNDEMKIGFEIGRTKLSTMFDSRVHFDSYFNGVLMTYDFLIPEIIDFNFRGGINVLDGTRNRYSPVLEAVWNHIASTPITFKYSLVHWDGDRRCKYKAEVSHFLIQYEFQKYKLYCAYLLNHKSEEHEDGFYAGICFGEIKNVHDFMLDINYRYVHNHVIPSHDLNGYLKGFEAKGIFSLSKNLAVLAKLCYLPVHYSNLSGYRMLSKVLEVGMLYSW